MTTPSHLDSDKFIFIDSDLAVDTNNYGNDNSMNKYRLDVGNWFTSVKDAEDFATELRKSFKIKSFIRKVDPDWVADWNDVTQHKCYIGYDTLTLIRQKC